jgi:hypothetical protein
MRHHPLPICMTEILSQCCCIRNMEEGDVVICPHVVVHIHPGAKVIRLRIFQNEERPVAMVIVRDDYSVLILVTAKQPPVAHVPEPLPRFQSVSLLLLVEMLRYTPVNVS